MGFNHRSNARRIRRLILWTWSIIKVLIVGFIVVSRIQITSDTGIISAELVSDCVFGHNRWTDFRDLFENGTGLMTGPDWIEIACRRFRPCGLRRKRLVGDCVFEHNRWTDFTEVSCNLASVLMNIQRKRGNLSVTPFSLYVVAGARFELTTFGLWARRATGLLHPASMWSEYYRRIRYLASINCNNFNKN